MTITSMKIYIDGTLASTNSTNIFSSIYNSSQDLLIGERIDITNRNWHGNIADVRIYDADIGASNITDLSNGINYQTNLVGHWLKDKEDVIDHSVNTNDGTDFGSTYSLDGPAS